MVFRTGLLCVCGLLFIGCGHQDAQSFGPAKSLRSVIILIPGYYGSRLVQPSDGKVIWISAAQALFGNQPLTLPVPGLGFDDAIELTPDGILNDVQVIPWLYAIDAYGSMLKALEDDGRGRSIVMSLSYDWRADPMRAVKKLDETIRNLSAEGTTEIQLVAHSMGGLIAAYYLRYGAQEPDRAKETWEGAARVTHVVLAGVPFDGTMIAFRNSQYGVQIGLNRTLLQPIAVSSFPATYYLLPMRDQDVLLTRSLEPVKGAVHDPRNWTAQQWGLLKPPGLSRDVAVHRRAYTADWLGRGQRFSGLLNAPTETRSSSKPLLLSIVGVGEKTLATGVWTLGEKDEESSLIFDQQSLARTLPDQDPAILFRDGDGSVTTESATLPPAYSETFRMTGKSYRVGHSEMMKQSAIHQTIVQFLRTARSES